MPDSAHSTQWFGPHTVIPIICALIGAAAVFLSTRDDSGPAQPTNTPVVIAAADTPTNTPTTEPTATATLTPTITPAPTLTPTAEATFTPTIAPSPTLTPTALGGQAEYCDLPPGANGSWPNATGFEEWEMNDGWNQGILGNPERISLSGPISSLIAPIDLYPSCNSYDITAKFAMPPGSTPDPEPRIGIVLRTSDSVVYYFLYRFYDANSSAQAEVWKSTNGQMEQQPERVEPANPGRLIGDPEGTQIKIQIRGNEVSLFRDGGYLLAMTIPELQPTEMGVYSEITGSRLVEFSYAYVPPEN